MTDITKALDEIRAHAKAGGLHTSECVLQLEAIARAADALLQAEMVDDMPMPWGDLRAALDALAGGEA